jgi:hypothetical protein
MKPLLTTLLLLLCLSGMGQVYPITLKFWNDSSLSYSLEGDYTDYVYGEKSRMVVSRSYIKFMYEVLSTDWDEYERECWNDSIVEGYEYTWNTKYYSDGHGYSCNYLKCYIICFKYPDYDCQKAVYPQDFKSHFGFDYDTYNPIIDHLKPDPGKGFIEFIRKKYGI